MCLLLARLSAATVRGTRAINAKLKTDQIMCIDDDDDLLLIIIIAVTCRHMQV